MVQRFHGTTRIPGGAEVGCAGGGYAPIVPWKRCIRKQESKVSTRRKRESHGGPRRRQGFGASRGSLTKHRAKRQNPRFSVALRASPFFSVWNLAFLGRSKPAAKPYASWHVSNLPCPGRQHRVRRTRLSLLQRCQATTPVRHIAPANAARFRACSLRPSSPGPQRRKAPWRSAASRPHLSRPAATAPVPGLPRSNTSWRRRTSRSP